ncbi:MAG: ATP synthase subunit I [Deltaproteobacteria bacterium]|nr:ATP synthase subunit I [Deltaproteobacteria bacterium]
MRSRLVKLNRSLEKSLFQKGFQEPEVRAMIRCQFYLAIISTLLVLGLVRNEWALGFLAGTSLGTLNFLALARVIQELVHARHGGVTALLVSFYGRLILTGGLLFALLVWVRIPVTGLLSGLSTVVISIFLWGGIHFVYGKNVKEA